MTTRRELHCITANRSIMQYQGQGKSFTPQPLTLWLLFDEPIDLKRAIVATELWCLSGFRAQGRGPCPSGFEGVCSYRLPCALFSPSVWNDHPCLAPQRSTPKTNVTTKSVQVADTLYRRPAFAGLCRAGTLHPGQTE